MLIKGCHILKKKTHTIGKINGLGSQLYMNLKKNNCCICQEEKNIFVQHRHLIGLFIDRELPRSSSHFSLMGYFDNNWVGPLCQPVFCPFKLLLLLLLLLFLPQNGQNSSQNVLLTSKEGKRQPTLSKVKNLLCTIKMVKTGAVDDYGCRVGRTVPRPTRNCSRVAASVTLIGNRFHSLIVLGEKEFL